MGRIGYEPAWSAMQSFTAVRSEHTRDELWIAEHPPVYTVGLAGRAEHFPRIRPSAGVPSATLQAIHASAVPPVSSTSPVSSTLPVSSIPLVRSDRGGQITYHGPGQVIVYALVDLVRRGVKVREMVCLLEQAAIDVLGDHGIAAERKAGAPGVYVAGGDRRGAKIAALGLKVKRQGCYHGISLNVDMDLTPFAAIDPCGYPGLPVTSMRQMGVQAGVTAVGEMLAGHIARALEALPAPAGAARKDS